MRLRSVGLIVAGGLVALATAASARGALTFTFTSTGNPQADAGFAAAGQIWSNLFNDSMNVNITAGFTGLGAGILGSTSTTSANYTYSSVRAKLVSDATSTDDASAVAALQATQVNMLLNRTSTNPNGSGSATPYFDNDGDANNTSLNLSNANAKALGLLAGSNPATDASITFSTAFTWDFNRNDGITGGTFDFVAVAAHEIGHALGFLSGVDILDGNSPPVNGPFNDNLFTFVSPLDLYRYSTTSFALGSGIIDWTADTRTKYFSVNGGATSLGTFSTGINFGDGRQDSHWKDNLGLGIMDPTLAPGELGLVTGLDVRAFDVIGYNLLTPEPATLTSFAASAFLLLRRGRVARRVA
jgi:hypothetical protein